MNLEKLDNFELTDRLGKLVKTERKIMHLILECIAEIDARQIYLARAYPSLYEFLVKEYGYSPSAALRRIESARLLREIPEVSEKIETGALNLSQLSQVQQAIRTVQKTGSRKVPTPEKLEMLKKIEFMSQKTTELIIAQAWQLPVEKHDKEKVHRDESVTLTIHLSKEEMATLETLRNSLSHCVPSGKWSDLLMHLAEKEQARRTAVKTREMKRSANKDPSLGNSKKLNSETRKPVRLNLRESMLHNNSCQYLDPITEKKCESQKFLQVDHIHPVWAGGGNERNNLQVLCASHNKFKYQQETQSPPLRR